MAEEIEEKGVSPELLERSQLGNMASMVLESIDAWLVEHERHLIAEVVKKIEHRDGKLDPDVALHAWFQIHSARNLRSHLELVIRQGKQAAARLQKVSAS